MTTRGSRAMGTGLIIVLLAVSAGINFDGGFFVLLLSFSGALAGVNVIAVGVRLADDPTAFGGAVRALTALLRRNLAVVVIILASSAVTAIAGEAGPVICFIMFILLLLGVFLVNVAVLGA